jgi:hypothetical protein
MAEEFVEANVFQVPDLVGAANQQQRQKKQDELRTLGYLDRYQKKNGKYLTAHQPLVQERWNSVVKAMDAVAANDNINTRRALGEAYTGYSKVAGEAQFVAQEYAGERKYLSENANKLAMSVADADAQLQQLNNTAINEMQLSELATNPMSLRLPRAYQSSIVGTVKQGQNLASLSRAKLNNEWLATGKLDRAAAERWADEWASQNYTKGQEDEMVAQVLVADNIKGRNGRLEIGEFAQIQGMPQEDKDRYVAMYIDRAKQNFLDNLPQTAKVSGSGGSDGSSKLKVGSVSFKSLSPQERKTLMPSYVEKDTRRPSISSTLNPSGIEGSTTKGKPVGFKVANLKAPLTIGDGSKANSFGFGPEGQLFVLASEKAVPELTPQEAAGWVEKSVKNLTEEDYAIAQGMKMDADPTYQNRWRKGTEGDILRLKGSLGDQEFYNTVAELAGEDVAQTLRLVDYKKYLEQLEKNNGQVLNETQPTENRKTLREEAGQARRAAMEEEFLGGEQAPIF